MEDIVFSIPEEAIVGLGAAAFLSIFYKIFIIALILAVVQVAGMWKVFQKAGYKGWEALVPIYNYYLIIKLVGKPWWWLLLMFLPYIGIIWVIWTTNLLGKSFGKDAGFTLGLILLPFVFWPILGFGKSQYLGTETNNSTDQNQPINV